MENKRQHNRMIPRSFKIMNSNKSYNDPAFTLIEIVIIIIIAAIALPAMVFVFTEGVRESYEPERYIIAVNLAKEKMDRIVADKNNSARGYSYIDNSNYPDESSITDFPGFSRNVNIEEVNGDDLSTPEGGSGFKKIRVTVEWEDGGKNIYLENLVTNY